MIRRGDLMRVFEQVCKVHWFSCVATVLMMAGRPISQLDYVQRNLAFARKKIRFRHHESPLQPWRE